jgi:predicted metal-binding transcription factor (methanogenesis marker protein 9)
MFRDITLQQAGIPSKEYMRLKRQLSEKIIHHIYNDREGDDAC